MARRQVSDVNLLIAVDKPVGCTSHDVVAQVRRAVGERRVGHAGTLDPLASGVMVVGIGQATRLLGQLTLDTKSYVAEISFGAETSTDDAEGEVVRAVEPAAQLYDQAFAQQAIAALVGVQQQVPPAYSAISIDGVRAYRRARAGDEVELPARPIEVFDALLLGIEETNDGPVWTAAFAVSKGTYIRALARDLGRSVGSAAHLAGLRRTASGSIGLARCVPLEGLDPARARAAALDPVRALGIPGAALNARWLADVLCGKRLPLDALPPEMRRPGHEVALVIEGELRAIATVEDGSVRMKQVFPQGIGGVCA